MNPINMIRNYGFKELSHPPDPRPDALTINLFSPQATVDFVTSRLQARRGFALATLNLDHAVKLRHDAIVADGFPIVWLGRLKGATIERTTGSDLTLPLIAAARDTGTKLAIIGTTQSTLDRASAILKEKFPDLVIALTCAPEFGFDPHSASAQTIIDQLGQSGAGLCLLAMGAPKQEVFAARAAQQLPHIGFVSVGASIDFIAGTQERAPVWMQKRHMEWVWRLMSNPKRMFARYVQCALLFPVLLIRTLSERAKALS